MKTGRITLIIFQNFVDHVLELGVCFVSATFDTFKTDYFTYYHSIMKCGIIFEVIQLTLKRYLPHKTKLLTYGCQRK